MVLRNLLIPFVPQLAATGSASAIGLTADLGSRRRGHRSHSRVRKSRTVTSSSSSAMDSAIALVDHQNEDSKGRAREGAAIVTIYAFESSDADAAAQEDTVNETADALREAACYFDILPFEVRIKIFKCLDIVDVVKISAVSRGWHTLAFDGSLWSTLNIEPFCRNITGDQMVFLGKAAGKFLNVVNFRGCVQFTASHLRELTPHCPNIQTLQLSGCRDLDGGSLDVLLSSLPNLEVLDVSALLIVINLHCLTISRSCKNLKKLNLSWCRYISARGIESIAKECRKLVVLKIDGVTKLNEATLALIGKLSDLKVLSLALSRKVEDSDIRGLLSGDATLAGMTHVNFSNRDLSDAIIRDLADHCPLLTHVQLNGCTGFTDEGLIYLARRCPELEAIDLEDCPAVNDDVLNAFAAYLSNLRIACLSCSDHITDEGVTKLLRECNTLSRIDLDHCQLLTDVVLRNLAVILIAGAQDATDDAAPRSIEVEIYDCRNISIAAVRETVRRVNHAGVRLKLKGYYTWQAGNNADGQDDDDDSARNGANGNGGFASSWTRSRLLRHFVSRTGTPDAAIRFHLPNAFRPGARGGAGGANGQNGAGRRAGQCAIL